MAQLLECGLLRGSFVPPKEVARLRDLIRYRTKLTQERVRETHRIQKLLEDAGIKLDSVATDVLGKAARRMLEALVAGERRGRLTQPNEHVEGRGLRSPTAAPSPYGDSWSFV